MFLLYDDGNHRLYGLFDTMDAAKVFVHDVLAVSVDWSDPKYTVTGSVMSRPRARNNFHIAPVPVNPSEFTNQPLGFH
jgi:hypothetical protein